ncbi:hypothetical protein PS2_045122 [Malus domestica]
MNRRTDQINQLNQQLRNSKESEPPPSPSTLSLPPRLSCKFWKKVRSENVLNFANLPENMKWLKTAKWRMHEH